MCSVTYVSRHPSSGSDGHASSARLSILGEAMCEAYHGMGALVWDSSARRLAGARFFPVDEQEPARRVELRLARSGQNLELQLFDFVLGAAPAVEREITVPPAARQEHHGNHRVVGDQDVVLVERSKRPHC